MSDSVRPHRQQPNRLPHPWDSPGKNTGVGCHFLLQCMKVKRESDVAQSHPTLCDPMDSPWEFPGKNTGVGRQCTQIKLSVLWNRDFLYKDFHKQKILPVLILCHQNPENSLTYRCSVKIPWMNEWPLVILAYIVTVQEVNISSLTYLTLASFATYFDTAVFQRNNLGNILLHSSDL